MMVMQLWLLGKLDNNGMFLYFGEKLRNLKIIGSEFSPSMYKLKMAPI
jgi:hypothetical protein